MKRASDFARFATWLVANKGRPLAAKEPELYAYLSHLRSTGASATSGESFVKAYRFFMRLTGAMRNPGVSSRVEGVAKSMATTKRPLWQAPPLTVEAVRALEDFVHDNRVLYKVAIAGFMLFCVYSSARWSDAARATGMKSDVSSGGLVLLETATLHYKTKAKDRKDAVLPLIALGCGLVLPAWGPRWMQARARLGMEAFPCVMPAVSVGGSFLLWLRELLHSQKISWRS